MGISRTIKSRFQNLKPSTRKSGSATASTLPPSTSTQSTPQTTILPPQGTSSRLSAKANPVSLPSLQEKIWQQAYSNLESEEPTLVEAFEKIILSQLHPGTASTASTDRIKVTSLQMKQFVEDWIDRTKKEIALKQRVDNGLQAVNSIRGIIDGAIRAAPEAAVIWAAVSLGIEGLTGPVTEALKNRQGIQYVLGRTEWYWNLAGLLLDENKSNTATVLLCDGLEKNIVELFQKLLAYQIRSICLYDRNKVVAAFRDALLIDDWASKLADIKEAEKSVQGDMDQYNTQDSRMKMNDLNDTTAALQKSLGNIYAEMQGQAEHQKKRQEDDRDKQCLIDLNVSDPQTDKMNIEDKKGGLLKDSYQWILEHRDFQNFKNNAESGILWIKGDPGKGKTMLLCGIINELESDPSMSPYYFFCQATGGDRLSSATSVLRSLIHQLARRNKQLMKHVRENYDYMGKTVFQNENAWHELRKIATAMLNDVSLGNAILVVDALDECTVGRDHLLDFITESSPAKWIVSSRNWVDIKASPNGTDQKVRIELELNQDSVSEAVESYIETKVDQLLIEKDYDQATRSGVLEYLKKNSGGTFLWVALVCGELFKPGVQRRHTLGKLVLFPAGLDSLYERMIEQMNPSEDAQLCREILATVVVAYRPLTLKELRALVQDLGTLKDKEITEVIASCSSLLSLQHAVVSFVHQSAKDYLLTEGPSKILLPHGIEHQHQSVFARSLDLICEILERDIYHLQDPGYLINEVSTPDPDPLAAIRYSCIFWIGHLHDSSATFSNTQNDRISTFFEKKYLYWLEALSLLHSVYIGVKGMGRLETFLQDKSSKNLQDTVKDARRFLLSHTGVIEIAPLQIYVSALIFSPTNSLIRTIFRHEEPSWIEPKPRVEANWDACLQTLEGHNEAVESVVFSNDGQRLASGSYDKTAKIWDATSGACVQTLEGHSNTATSVAFSKDGQRLASGSWDMTVKIWDATSGACVQTLEGHSNTTTSVAFSKDGQRLASGSDDKTVKIWDATSGACVQTHEGHSHYVTSLVFSNDGQRLVSGSLDTTVKIWDATSGACVQTLKGHSHYVTSMVFSNDGQRLASGSGDKTVKIWDATSGACLQTLEGHSREVTSVVFSNDGQRLVSGSWDNTVKIWDATSGACLQTLEGHSSIVTSVVFSNDGQRLASGSWDNTVKIWDATSGACVQTLEGHRHYVTSLVFSNDGQRLASGSDDKTVRIWDATSGACLETRKRHPRNVTSAVFANDRQRLASQPSSNQLSLIHSELCDYTLSDDNTWILQDGQRKLWLPQSYRPIYLASAQTGVGLVLSSYRIIAIGFRSPS